MLIKKIDLYFLGHISEFDIRPLQTSKKKNDLGCISPGCNLWKVLRRVLIRFSLKVSWYSALNLSRSGLFWRETFNNCFNLFAYYSSV